MLNELDLDPVSDELPIACKLSGNELAERGEEVDELFKEVEQVRELADGYAFRFAGTAAMASSLLQFTLVERSCCPFFTFEFVFEPNEGPLCAAQAAQRGPRNLWQALWGRLYR